MNPSQRDFGSPFRVLQAAVWRTNLSIATWPQDDFSEGYCWAGRETTKRATPSRGPAAAIRGNIRQIPRDLGEIAHSQIWRLPSLPRLWFLGNYRKIAVLIHAPVPLKRAESCCEYDKR